MTDTREMTMEQGAQRSLDSLLEDLARLERITELRDTAERQGSGLRSMLDEQAEQAREEMEQRTYGIETRVTLDVHLYGGGPAGGIEFEVDRGRWGWEVTRARFWHQDWFQPRGYVNIDNDVADRLFELWGLTEYEFREE